MKPTKENMMGPIRKLAIGSAFFCFVVLVQMQVLAATGLMITKDGYYAVNAGPDGKPVLEKITQVMDLRGDGPTPPPPDTADPIAVQVQAWAVALNDPTSQQALKEVYSRVGAASAGQSREKVMAALRQGTDGVLDATGGRTKWQPFRDNVSKLIDAEEAKGPIDWPKFCASVAKGLESGTALDPALLQLIINLILQIIQLFFGGGSGV